MWNCDKIVKVSGQMTFLRRSFKLNHEIYWTIPTKSAGIRKIQRYSDKCYTVAALDMSNFNRRHKKWAPGYLERDFSAYPVIRRPFKPREMIHPLGVQ